MIIIENKITIETKHEVESTILTLLGCCRVKDNYYNEDGVYQYQILKSDKDKVVDAVAKIKEIISKSKVN
jgi:hypothetical protein